MTSTKIIKAVLAAQILGSTPIKASNPTFHQAADRGMVDVSSDYWARQDMPVLLTELRALQPGIINQFAFLYGGPTSAWLAKTEQIAADFHAADPTALLGATLPEALHSDYHLSLSCGSFSAADMISPSKQGGNVYWIDLSRPASEAYYRCLGDTFIDQQFKLIHFEAPSGVIAHSSNRDAAVAAYRRLADHFHAEKAYLSGNIELSKLAPLDAVYLPARFYHNLPDLLKYRNKVDRPGIGVGYSYVLSKRIIADTKSQVPPGVEVFFDVDNWDPNQDDLRRLMELDPANRRYMLEQSSAVAEAKGVHFVPPLEHCVGCVPVKDVGDHSEIRNDGRSEYRVSSTGDLATIQHR